MSPIARLFIHSGLVNKVIHVAISYSYAYYIFDLRFEDEVHRIYDYIVINSAIKLILCISTHREQDEFNLTILSISY